MVEMAALALVLVLDALCFFATGLFFVFCFGIYACQSLNNDSVQIAGERATGRIRIVDSGGTRRQV